MMIGSINSPHDELIERHVHDQREISSGSRILKWRYVSTIFLAIFCGEMTIEMSIIAPLLRHFCTSWKKKVTIREKNVNTRPSRHECTFVVQVNIKSQKERKSKKNCYEQKKSANRRSRYIMVYIYIG